MIYSCTLSLTFALDGVIYSCTLSLTFALDGEVRPSAAGWAPGPLWTDAENLAYNGIRSPDRQALSESLYRLSYPGSHISTKKSLNMELSLQASKNYGSATQDSVRVCYKC